MTVKVKKYFLKSVVTKLYQVQHFDHSYALLYNISHCLPGICGIQKSMLVMEADMDSYWEY